MNDPAARRNPRRFAYWLLAIPIVATLWPPLYAHADPEIAGIPFFYWYQFIWVVLSSVVTVTVYLLTREDKT
ncbi:MAG TPA: DUF3311 domain-containing protein [Candidatus Eremiobacteraceae bacterium]